MVFPHSIGLETLGFSSLFSKTAFLKTGIIMIFHSVFVGLGCFSLEEKHAHRDYTSTHKSPRHQVQSLGQVWPATSSSSSSDPSWTLPCPFSHYLESHQECLTPSVPFSFSALFPHQTPHSPAASQCPTFPGMGSSGQGRTAVEMLALLTRSCAHLINNTGSPSALGNLMFWSHFGFFNH